MIRTKLQTVGIPASKLYLKFTLGAFPVDLSNILCVTNYPAVS